MCEDPEVVGAPFYVMELIPGEVLASEIPAALVDDAEHDRIADELIDALVELHAVEWDALALEGFGKPTGYLERQLRRFLGLWEHNKTRDVPEVAQIARWLADNLPESPPGDAGTRRLSPGQRDVRPPGARPADRDLRLGDGHNRRPPRRRRLHGLALEPGRRFRRAASTSRTSPHAPGSPIAAPS